MRRQKPYSSYFAVAALACLTVFPLAAGDDPGAGGWQMSVLSGPSQIPVPAPSAVTDAGFKAELASVKSAQASLTDAQKKAIDYWKAGGAVRWNQILLELVASTDLPPEPNRMAATQRPMQTTRSRIRATRLPTRRMAPELTAMCQWRCSKP